MPEAHDHPQFAQGRDRLALIVKLLLQQNGLSHAQLHDFYLWCIGDGPSWLSRSQISTLRNSKLPKPGGPVFDALASINLRLAQLAGETSPEIDALPALGPLPTDLKRLREEKPFFMRNPHTGLAMDVGDLFRVYCSRLQLDENGWGDLPPTFDERDAERISNRLAVWAQRWMVGQGLIPVEAKKPFLEAYPVEDKKRQERLWAVALGQKTYGSADVCTERDDLLQLIGQHELNRPLGLREFDQWSRGQAL